MASFLLGLPTSGSVQTGTPRTEQYRYYALFAQDDWKLGARATLNIGLRWDYQPPVTVKDDLTVSGFDANAPNPLQSQLPQGAATINPATGQPLILERRPAVRQPRRPGVAVQVRLEQHPAARRLHLQDQRLAVARTNYGRSYLGLSSGGQAGVYTTDFQRTTPFIATAPNGVDPGTPWANPFPDGFLQPLAGELGLLTGDRHRSTIPESRLRDSLHRSVDGRRRRPAAVEHRARRRLRRQQGQQARRDAATSTRCPKSENDKAIPSLGGNADYLNVTFPNPFAGLVPGQGLNAATVARGQLLRPYPQFGGFSMNRLNLGSAYYNALEAVATKRYCNGVMFAVNYTWMKLEDQINFFTNYDTEPYRDIQGDQRRHRLAITTLIDLPFGPGQAVRRQHVAGWSPALIGGWQFNTIGEIQSGRPLALERQRRPARSDVALPKSEQSFERWFDNSSTALNNPRPDGTFAWSVLGTERLPRRQEPLPRRQRADRAAVVVVALQDHARWRRRQPAVPRSRCSTSSTSRVYGGPNTNPNSAELRRSSTRRAR